MRNAEAQKQTTEAIGRVNSTMESAMQKIEKIEVDLNRQLQDAQANNLVISGLAKVEDPTSSFWKLVELVNAEITRDDVNVVHLLKAKREKTKNGSDPRFISDTIFVKFRSNQAKGRLINAKTRMGATFDTQLKEITVRDVPEPGKKPRVIMFRDHLTERSMQLFDKAKERQVKLQYKFVWTKNGQILMRPFERGPVFRIRSHADLDRLPKISDIPTVSKQSKN